MRQRQAVVGLSLATLLSLCLLVVFAVELIDTQRDDRRTVEARVSDRARLTGDLIDTVFGSVDSSVARSSPVLMAPRVSDAELQALSMGDDYVALLGPRGGVIAHSRGFTPEARSTAMSSGAVGLARSSRAYGLGDLEPYSGGHVVVTAVALSTPYGTRVLVSGAPSRAYGSFLTSDLRDIPEVTGARAYVIDGADTVIASTYAAHPLGYRFSPSSRQAIARGSGDRNHRYYDVESLAHSRWQILLTAPNGPLFATIEGIHKWLPWAIIAAFALIALIALGLRVRLVRIAAALRDSNARLEQRGRELAEANHALELRARELQRSNDELEQFASIASHDLQEPLRKVRTFTQRVTETEAERLSERGSDYLQRANAAAERMQQLIEDLLRFSRLATHGRSFAPVDLAALAREVSDDLSTQVRASGATLQIGELPTISGDAVQLRQLLQNLLSNAMKFRREGVPLQIAIGAETHDDTVEITVTDNGIGFEPQYARRIFRVFERLHGRGGYPGTGIGLALCAKIVDRHGGTIRADGTPGEGARFTILLPTNLTEEALSLSPTAWRRHDAESEDRYAAV